MHLLRRKLDASRWCLAVVATAVIALFFPGVSPIRGTREECAYGRYVFQINLNSAVTSADLAGFL
uniref:Uncharacterized protein n=1 Tax=mine drainage metagenome TaxID=410659 RepID=E6QV13_9ZZZZ